METAIECEHQIVDATKRFVEVVAESAPATWMAEPPRGPWTLSQIVEHVTIANRGISGVLAHLAPLSGPTDITDEEMPYLFYGGDEPPDVATPTGTWTDITEALTALDASAVDLVEWARTSGVDLRRHGRRHPAFGMLSGAQWLRFAAVHTWRHRAQALAVRKALEGCPRRGSASRRTALARRHRADESVTGTTTRVPACRR